MDYYADVTTVNSALRPFGMDMSFDLHDKIDWYAEAKSFGNIEPDSARRSALLDVNNPNHKALCAYIIGRKRVQNKYCVLPVNKVYRGPSDNQELLGGFSTNLGGGYTGSDGVVLSCPFDGTPVTKYTISLIHELGHSMFGLKDEYKEYIDGNHESHCLMMNSFNLTDFTHTDVNAHFCKKCCAIINEWTDYPNQ